MSIRELEPNLSGRGLRVGVAQARFNEDIGEGLRSGCLAELARLGIPHRAGLGKTGIVGMIEGGAPGPTLLIRADMDALPIHERTGLGYASEADGKMHACGHDIHTVTLLGAAEVIKGLAPQLRGRVALVFQPAEELLSGAAAMIADGALEGLDASMAIGFHNSPSMEPGTFGWVKGACQAGSAAFDIVHTIGFQVAATAGAGWP